MKIGRAFDLLIKEPNEPKMIALSYILPSCIRRTPIFTREIQRWQREWWGPSHSTYFGPSYCPKPCPQVLHNQGSSNAGHKWACAFGQWRWPFIRTSARFCLACKAWSRRDNFLHACSPESLGSKLSNKLSYAPFGVHFPSQKAQKPQYVLPGPNPAKGRIWARLKNQINSNFCETLGH